MAIHIQLKDDCSEKIRYNDADFPIYSMKGRLSEYPNYRAPNHWHDDIEFIHVLSGEMYYNVNGTVVHMQKNEGIFVNAGQMHFGFSENAAECQFICLL